MDRTNKELEEYFNVVRKRLGPRGEARFRHQLPFLYRDIDFAGKRVLDIGGGAGIHTLYAAANGARYVLNLEPEGAGSTRGVLEEFAEWKNELQSHNVEICASTFQDYTPPDEPFDVVIIQDAINHLDEDACVELHRLESSRSAFLNIFSKLAALASPGSILVFADCSRYNAFPALGLGNPFDPAIEWHKHQSPKLWMHLLREVGFESRSLRWSSPARFGRTGQLLLGNSALAFFFTSHFVAVMSRRPR